MHYPLPAALLCFALLAPTVQAQEAETLRHELRHRNHISVEVGGNGGLYTLNYERQLTPHLAARVGIEYFPVVEAEGQDTDVALLVPILLNFTPRLARIWGAPLSAEVGGGVLLIYSSGMETVYASQEDRRLGIGMRQEFRDFGVTPTATAALRMHVASRVVLRAGVAALPNRSAWKSGTFLIWPLLSVGYRF